LVGIKGSTARRAAFLFDRLARFLTLPARLY